MAIKVVDNFEFPKDFGFSSSAPSASAPSHRAGGKVGYAKGGKVKDPDAAEDAAMVTRGVHQHEANLHKGEKETALKLARGGSVRLPRGMRPKVERPTSPIGRGARKLTPPMRMPKPNVNRPPMVPESTATPPGLNPGGVMPYGVQPSAEPAGGYLKRGGRIKKK